MPPARQSKFDPDTMSNVEEINKSNIMDESKVDLDTSKMSGKSKNNDLALNTSSSSGSSKKSKKVKLAEKKKKPKTFCGKIVGFIRGFWDTTLTVDKEDKTALIKTTIRELVVYLIFLLILCLITFNMTSTTYFYYTTVMQNLFLGTKASDGNLFENINTIEHWWNFVAPDGPFVNGIHWDKWYNGMTNDIAGDENYIFYENKLLGVPRIRQLRIKEDVCSVHKDFQKDIKHCYAEYSTANQDTDAFGDPTNDAFLWKSEAELGGSGFLSPDLKIQYDGAGYIQDLAQNRNITNMRIDALKQNRWLDRQTRVIFIDFAVYNANINLFCVVRLTTEFPATGGAITSSEFRTVKMTSEESTWGTVNLVLEYIYIIMIGYYLIEEIIEIRMHRLKYFKSLWNVLDVVIIILSIVAVAFRFYRDNKVSVLLSQLQKQTTKYPVFDGTDFEWISFLQVRYVYMAAFLAFFAWIKLFKYISFNTTMTQLQLTLSRCATDIAGFSVMFFIIFVGYAQFGYLVFGQTIYNFSTFPESLFTLFRIILGDFDFHELEKADYVLGPIYFITYVFLVFFVLLNMFLAIINDTYSVVKEELAMKENDFQLTDYIKKGYKKVLQKLHLKSKHIKDIQDALNTADINNDNILDWEEWRNDLRMRGIPDNEIEAVFAKYDTDGDMQLNEEEQEALRADLKKTRDEINKQMQEVENTADNAAAVATAQEKQNGSDGSDSSPDVMKTLDMPKRTGFAASGGMGGGVSLNDIEKIKDALNSAFVGNDEFNLVARRMDKLERSVGAVVGKIDSIIRKLESLDRIRNSKKSKKQLQQQNPNNLMPHNVVEIDALSVDESEVQRNKRLQDSLGNNAPNLPLGMPSQSLEQTNEINSRSRK